MDISIHVANVLFLSSYLIRNILWLRVLTIIALICLAPYYYFQPQPLYAPLAWNLVFGMINMYQIFSLLLGRRSIALSAEQQVA